jgi:hypothetical protein
MHCLDANGWLLAERIMLSCYHMCTFDINVCMRKDYAEMFSSRLLSMFVYESSCERCN